MCIFKYVLNGVKILLVDITQYLPCGCFLTVSIWCATYPTVGHWGHFVGLIWQKIGFLSNKLFILTLIDVETLLIDVPNIFWQFLCPILIHRKLKRPSYGSNLINKLLFFARKSLFRTFLPFSKCWKEQ